MDNKIDKVLAAALTNSNKTSFLPFSLLSPNQQTTFSHS
jgi:hypothetical protein